MEYFGDIELTTEQLSKMLGVTTTTIYRWRQDGLPFKKYDRKVRFEMSEVQKWLDERGYRKSVRK